VKKLADEVIGNGAVIR